MNNVSIITGLKNGSIFECWLPVFENGTKIEIPLEKMQKKIFILNDDEFPFKIDISRNCKEIYSIS